MKNVMRNTMAASRNIIMIYFVLCVLSCSRHTGLDTITLPSDSALKDADRFAVIIETYISLKDRPGPSGIIISHARRKEIYEVKGTEFVSKNSDSELWIHLSGGWLKHSCVELYPSKEKAETAAARLK